MGACFVDGDEGSYRRGWNRYYNIYQSEQRSIVSFYGQTIIEEGKTIMCENMLTREELDRLHAVCNKATPGPWQAVKREHCDAGVTEHCVVIGRSIASVGCKGKTENDAAFIAAARTEFPRALATVDALYEQIDKLTTELDDVRRVINQYDTLVSQNTDVYQGDGEQYWYVRDKSSDRYLGTDDLWHACGDPDELCQFLSREDAVFAIERNTLKETAK